MLEVEERDFYQSGTKKTVMVAFLPAANLVLAAFLLVKLFASTWPKSSYLCCNYSIAHSLVRKCFCSHSVRGDISSPLFCIFLYSSLIMKTVSCRRFFFFLTLSLGYLLTLFLLNLF